MTAPAKSGRGLSLALCLALAGVAGLWAGQGTVPPQAGGGQQPVFRAGATYVNVDVYPRDKDGKIVDGLTTKDFEVLEDGKPQTVENFEFIKVGPTTPDEERRDPNSVGDSLRQAADPHNRVFVVYLDIYNTSLTGSHNIHQPAIDFLTRTIGPTDLFAVTTPEMPVNALAFARRVDTLEAELAKFWTWGQDRSDTDTTIKPRTPREEMVAACAARFDPTGALATVFIRRLRMDLLFSSLETLTARLGALKDERKSILLLTGLWWLPPDSDALRKFQTPDLPGLGLGPDGIIGGGGAMTRAGVYDGSACNTELSRLASIDFDRRFREFLPLARRNNVAFYPVDTEGLRTGVTVLGIMPAGQLMKRTGDLKTLAENTGGRAIVDANDLGVKLRSVADDVSAFYLLGYYSTNPAQDGRFRRIEVKVKTPGVSVTARNGYLAPTAAMTRAADAAAASPAATLSPVEEAVGRLARLRPDATLYGYGIPSLAGIGVVTEIASREIEAGRWRTGADVKLTITNAAGTTTATGKIEAGARSTLIRIPAAQAGTGPWNILAQVSGADGPLNETFDVPAPKLAAIGPVQYFRATPSPRSLLRPVADFQYRRTERIHLEWTLGKALDERTARLLSRRGDALPLQVNLTEKPDGDRTILAADLQLAPLSEGDYVIELMAGQDGNNVRILVPFRLIR